MPADHGLKIIPNTLDIGSESLHSLIIPTEYLRVPLRLFSDNPLPLTTEDRVISVSWPLNYQGAYFK